MTHDTVVRDVFYQQLARPHGEALLGVFGLRDIKLKYLRDKGYLGK